MQITLDVRELEDYAQTLNGVKGDVRPALASTLNWVGNKANTQVKRALAKQTGLKYGTVGDAIQIEPARADEPEFDIKATGTPIPLIEFGAVQRKEGVWARPWGNGRLFRGAFIAPVSGGEQVFHRVGPSRLPIKKMWGPGIARELLRDAVPEAFKKSVEENFGDRFKHELERLFARRRKR